MAAWSGNVLLVRDFLRRGADVTIRDSVGNTPLHRGCLTSLAMVKMLAEEGADIHAKNNIGQTAIDIVSLSKNVNAEILTYLTNKRMDDVVIYIDDTIPLNDSPEERIERCCFWSCF